VSFTVAPTWFADADTLPLGFRYFGEPSDTGVKVGNESIPYLPGLSHVAGKDICARFDGGRLSSDGGVLLFPGIEKWRCLEIVVCGEWHPVVFQGYRLVARMKRHEFLPKLAPNRQLLDGRSRFLRTARADNDRFPATSASRQIASIAKGGKTRR
jgi:hypothetical protein